MSGHSKWAKIKRKKGATDAKRGQLFSKLIREITEAAREGGGDEDGNARLRMAVQKAKESNMPADNIKRAVQRAAGGADGITFEEVSYEGYGPKGVAIMVTTLTDNHNRTTAEVRHAFTRYGNSLGENGCVAWMFERKGSFSVELKDKADPDEIELAVIDAGAEDIDTFEDSMEITTAVEDFDKVRNALLKLPVTIVESGLTMLPKSTVQIDDRKSADQILRLMEALEDLDDVQNVYGNFDIDDKIMKEIEEE